MEVEAKFALTEESLVERLQTVKTIDRLKLTVGTLVRVRDTYLDTSDRRLLAAGYACRQRRVGHARALLVTLKQIKPTSTAIHARQELEIKLPQDVPPPQWQDSPVRDRILSIIRDAPLQKLFEIDQTRKERNVMKDGVPIAEWSVDEVCVRVGNRRMKFAELEIQLKPAGTVEDLARLVAYVQTKWNLKPVTQSKFERVLAWVDGANATASKRRREPKIRLDDTMAEAARKTLLLHWRRMLAHEAGVRAGTDSEQVHDMRVATRRMRAALRVFDEFLDAKAFKPFAKMLRRTARMLGAVRDLDIFREKTQHYIDTLPDERKGELDQLLAAWHTEYQRARGELIAWLDNAEYAQFKKTFTEFLQTPGAGAAVVDSSGNAPRVVERVRDLLPIIVLRGWAAIRAYDELVSAPDVSLETLHQLRIASKYLRYTLEFFDEVLPPNAKLLIEQIKRLQDHLGNLQDAVVACRYLHNFLTWGEWSPASKAEQHPPLIVAPEVAAYLAVRQAEIRTLVQTFPQVWAPISHADFKKQLLALLAAW